MLAARLEGLEPDARRVLRAASILGPMFWPGALERLLGDATRKPELSAWLATLVDRELLHPRSESRFAEETELTFHHALLRDAAYATLTESDRRVGHRLAAEWLEQAGESESATLAAHFERGGEPLRALEHYQRAAQRALDGNDLPGATAHVERAVACGAEGERLGQLRLVEATACTWYGDTERAHQAVMVALALLPHRTPRWYQAVIQAGEVLTRTGDAARMRGMFEEMVSADQAGGNDPDRLIASARLAISLLFCGLREEAETLMRLATVTSPGDDDTVIASQLAARATLAHYQGDAGAAYELAGQASERYARIGDLRLACVARGNAGFFALVAGAPASEVESGMRAIIATAQALGLDNIEMATYQNRALALLRVGALEEALREQRRALDGLRGQGDRRMEGSSHMYLAWTLQAAGDLESAERDARIAVEKLEGAPPLRASALATLARVLLARGQPAAAFAPASEAHELLERLHGIEEGEGLVRLVWAEALASVGERERARAAFLEAERMLLERAARITDESWRRSFLEAVPEHALTMAAAARWRAQ
jgi:tetratricopeptide (TPR) repeat protein